MKTILHPAESRGTANFGWLQARYSFSFANYYNPDRLQFGKLRVLNDDQIDPAMGFGKHPHKNTEIVTIPHSGALKHQDSTGSSGIIKSGDIQVISAGTGVEQREVNTSTTEAVSLFQIWILPENEGVAPRYNQKKIAPLLQKNGCSTMVKLKQTKENKLWTQEQAYFSLGTFSEKTKTSYSLHNKTYGVYVFVIDGTILVDNETLNKRDAIEEIWDTDSIDVTASKNSRVLRIEIPMN
ncbi:pirin family protein [Marixanthomonas spongiae]|uniref:Pirin family protein n=1 Tax=Marixanthomonas spongiae TaxID=2174845 RepID=A0A2U0I0U8_9FLAO|nr:pirin-like bicupin family protein [Marixanthomonas spongiae]PVW14719.1 hypothetical protein DDV96_09390 [Marixanthomonas spongiae]